MAWLDKSNTTTHFRDSLINVRFIYFGVYHRTNKGWVLAGVPSGWVWETKETQLLLLFLLSVPSYYTNLLGMCVVSSSFPRSLFQSSFQSLFLLPVLSLLSLFQCSFRPWFRSWFRPLFRSFFWSLFRSFFWSLFGSFFQSFLRSLLASLHSCFVVAGAQSWFCCQELRALFSKLDPHGTGLLSEVGQGDSITVVGWEFLQGYIQYNLYYLYLIIQPMKRWFRHASSWVGSFKMFQRLLAYLWNLPGSQPWYKSTDHFSCAADSLRSVIPGTATFYK